MKNLPKEWQERAERYSEHNSDYNDGYHKGSSEMQQAILKVIEDYQKIYESELKDYELDEAGKIIYTAKLSSALLLIEEIQNVKPKK